jgi:hypothetical protein
MSSQVDGSQFSSFMQQIMQLSLKNKQLLEIGSPKKAEQALTRLDSKGKLKIVKADRLYLAHPDQILLKCGDEDPTKQDKPSNFDRIGEME